MKSHADLIALLLVAGCSGGPEPLGSSTLTGAPGTSPASMTERDASAGPSGTAGPGAPGAYDAVGYASWYGDGLEGQVTASGAPFANAGITAAHRSLPLGSYAEVTALDNGRTIMVRITDRGPQAPDREIDLSIGAAKLLGTSATALAAVRVRAVVPGPGDAAALREGLPATPRLDTPDNVLRALRRQLPTPAQTTGAKPVAKQRPVARPKPAVAARSTAIAPLRGNYLVQVAAFSTEARAQTLARALKGTIVGGNGVWRVRLGPFADRAAAQRARDAAAARGYGDASILVAP